MRNLLQLNLDSTEESSSDETGHLGGGNIASAATSIYRLQNRHCFFSAIKSIQSASRFRMALKPILTDDEKKLLDILLKALGLTFDEFKAKLSELKMSVKTFATILKDNAHQLRKADFKFESAIELLADLINRRLLPEKAMEKLIPKDLLARYEADKAEVKRPKLFS